MAYQRGSLKKVHRKEGETWVLRFRVTNAEGTRVEHTLPIGLVRDFPKDDDAWREVDRLGLGVRINNASAYGRVSFRFLAEHYLKADFGADAVRPKSANTIPIVEHYVRDYLIKRFSEVAADDIKPLDIQRWLKSLNEADGLAWTTISKIRGIMLRIYKIGIRHEHVTRNPVEYVETRSKSNYLGDHYHPYSNACDPKILALTATLRIGTHLCGNRTTCIRSIGTALERHIVG